MINKPLMIKIRYWMVVVFGIIPLLAVPLTHAAELRVVATIKPIHSLLAGLMNGIEPPHLLIEGSPTRFKIDPEQLSVLENSDLIIWVGPELEYSLQKTLTALPEHVQIVELLSSPNMKILSKRDDDTLRDPYFWLDIRNTLILLDDLAQRLIDIDPVRAHLYINNHREIRIRLRRMDREFEYGFRGLQAGVGYQYHDTQQYFEQAYALKTGGELLANPEDSVDSKKLIQLRSQLAEGRFNYLLTERGMSQSHLPLLLSEQGQQSQQLDSMGVGFKPGQDLYFELLRHNASVIKGCYKLNNGGLDQIVDVSRTSFAGDFDRGRFIMINHHGDEVRERDMHGKYQLLFFGYTSCPDICPLSLQTLSHALKKLGEQSKSFQPYFITVDPERDDVNAMRQYVHYFADNIIGLTGSQVMLKQMAQIYGVKYQRVYSDRKDRKNYQMDHSAGLIVVAPDGSFVTKLAHGISSTAMAQELKNLLL